MHVKLRSWWRAIAIALAMAAITAHGVTPGTDGVGQALIYPYFTVQSTGGASYNTLISVVNRSTSFSKVGRVRFREGRNGRAVASFNLFLPPIGTWTAAIVPATDGSSGARLVTFDRNCTDPPIPADAAGLR